MDRLAEAPHKERNLTSVRKFGLLVVLFCGGLSVLWGCAIGWAAYGGPLDFQAVYYGSRTLIEHHNPYSVSELGEVYRVESGDKQPVNAKQHELITLFVNTPGSLLIVAALAVLPIGVAQVVWMILTAGGLLLAGVLMWSLGSEHSPILSTLLVGFLLLNCQVVIAAGNTAAIVVGFCVIAAWCFIRNRFVMPGILLMAASLALKPHVSGLVLLYFFLAGTRYRKLALQAAILTVMAYVAAVIWLSSVAPTWLHDWQTNLATISAPGGMNDPRPASVASAAAAGNVISLQAIFSIFRDDPRFYNLASYAVCGLVMLPWAISTLRRRSLPARAWFAMAAIAPLSMLVTYHRVYDAKLLLLCIPACAMLWARGGRVGWAAMILTSGGVVINADVPLAALGIALQKIPISVATLPGQLLTVLIARPNQEALLAMSLFFLWAYMQKDIVVKLPADSGSTGSGDSLQIPNQAGA
jgi:hypothetical protein